MKLIKARDNLSEQLTDMETVGLAVTEHLIYHHNYKVAILDVDEQRGRDESLRLGPSCLGLHVDITDYAAQAQAFLTTFEWGGNRLDLFFANAGIGDKDSLYQDLYALDEKTGLPAPLDLRTIDVNLSAVIQGIHLARHFFSEKNNKQGGHIVATSSVVGLYPNYCIPLYAASKHGITGLVRSLAPVYAKDNITINSIHPTIIETNLMPKEAAKEFNQPGQVTPMGTAFKAFDAILDAKYTLTGQTMELSLDDVVFKQQPEYSTDNIRWMFGDQATMWEKVAAPLMPRPPGENAVAVKVPEKRFI